MIEISLNKVTKSFGFNNIFENISFDIYTNDVISIVGNNGSGKSTILKLIMKEEYCSSGTISVRKESKIGYLKQEYNEEKDIIVKELLYEEIKEILDIENKLRDYEFRMQSANEKELEKLLIKYGNLQEKFINLGGYEISEKIGRIITGFKLENLIDKNFNILSGGEKRRVKLASIMINNPNILLLDEPTNHMDIDTLNWFENYIKNYNGTVVIVSHDRYFLDRVSTKTIFLDNKNVEIYHGNYSYFLKENEKRILLQFESYKNQQKQINAMKQTIKKLREWGKIGDNERFFKRANCIERRLEKLVELERPKENNLIPLNLIVDKRSGNDVLVLKDFTLSIFGNILLENINLEIKYKDRVCLIGKNGAGKTTLIKEILNKNPNIKIGSNVNVGYVPQEIKFDDENITILDYAKKYYSGGEQHLRALLTKFLFYNDNVFKRLDKLSGGERVRLKLFELLNKNTNFLILDEVTNHIDIDTKEVIENALLNYDGTILFISHDRYFINKIATKVINIENKKLVSYNGNYDDYLNNKLYNK